MVTAILLLCTVSSFAQTKEETLEWLNQNSLYCELVFKYDGVQYSYNYLFYEDHFVEACSYLYNTSNWKNNKKIYYKDIFMQDVSRLDVENNSKSNPPITYINIRLSKYYDKGADDYSYEEKDGNRFSFYYKTNQPNARKNLEKVLRAIMHMAKLHGAEPYKDLFGE